MSDFSRNDRTSLAGRLRRDARASRPEFSEPLHERICRALWPCQSTPVIVVTRAPGAWRFPRWAVAVVAAAGLLAVVSVAWQAGLLSGWPGAPAEPIAAREHAEPGMVEEEPFAPGPAAAVVVDNSPDVESPPDFEKMTALVDDTTAQINDFVESTIVAQRFAYLDQDAILAVESLAGHLPFDLPSALAQFEPRGERDP